jgi:hypothetical protein
LAIDRRRSIGLASAVGLARLIRERLLYARHRRRESLVFVLVPDRADGRSWR